MIDVDLPAGLAVQVGLLEKAEVHEFVGISSDGALVVVQAVGQFLRGERALADDRQMLIRRYAIGTAQT